MENLEKVIVIAGPTASGKTSLSIELAKKNSGEIISADSMQIYKYMNIGTAKPDEEEKQGIPHYLMDFLEPSLNFSVVEYKKMSEQKIRELLKSKKLPIIVGGTGLYINSLIFNYEFSECKVNSELRDKLQKDAETHGAEFLHNMLTKIDPDSANTVHPNNIKRVIRALETYYETGKSLSEQVAETQKSIVKYDYKVFLLSMPRDILYERINQRVDIMIENGLIKEAKKLLDMGLSKENTSMQAIGYKEIIEYLEGDLSKDESIELLKRNTRRYAKRQITWFKKVENIVVLDVYNTKSEKNIEKIQEILAK